MKNIMLLITILIASSTIHGAYQSQQPPRGTAGNPTYKQRIETGIHNAGANISAATKNAWNSFLTKAEGLSLSVKDLPSTLKTKYDNSTITSSLQTVSTKTASNIKDFWNTLTSSFSKKENFAIINQQTDSPDDIFSPLHKQEESENFTL